MNTKFGLIFCKLIIVFPFNKNCIALYIYITLFPLLYEDLQFTEEQFKRCKKINNHACSILLNQSTEKKMTKLSKERKYEYMSVSLTCYIFSYRMHMAMKYIPRVRLICTCYIVLYFMHGVNSLWASLKWSVSKHYVSEKMKTIRLYH